MSVALAAQSARDAKLQYQDLTPPELEKFNRAFERSLLLGFKYREIIDIYRRHRTEILVGAMVAKDQMKSDFDGESPSGATFGGPLPIRAGYIGIGDDWDDPATFTTGAVQNWIHSGTTLLGGTAGNAIRIAKNAVFVVIGIGSYHPSPKIEAMQFTIDGKQKPCITTGWALRNSELKIKELDSIMVWKERTTVLGQVQAGAASGATVADIPYLVGVAYLTEAQLRVIDMATLNGSAAVRTVNEVIFTT